VIDYGSSKQLFRKRTCSKIHENGNYSAHPLVVDKGALLMGQGIVRLYYRKSDLDP
jgi:hypothetical protein